MSGVEGSLISVRYLGLMCPGDEGSQLVLSGSKGSLSRV